MSNILRSTILISLVVRGLLIGLLASTALTAANSARVTLHVVDCLGQRQHYRVESMVSYPPESKDVTARFRGLSASGVPYGLYKFRLRLEKPGPEALEPIIYGEVSVHRPVVFSEVLAHDGPYASTGDSYEIRGRIRNLRPGAGPVWVRVAPLFSTAAGWMQAEVNPDGSFVVPYSRYRGKYLLLLFQGSELIDSRVVVARSNGLHLEVEIDLPR